MNALDRNPEEGSLRSNPPKNLTVAEAALYIGICERGLREKIALREIRVVRIGRRVVLRLKDVEDWIEAQID